MGWTEWAETVEIEPSIYASDFSRLGEQLGALVEAGAHVFQFDAGDGHFIPEITIGPIVLASISPLVHGWGARLDCHLMVSEPERHFEAVAKAGGDSVTFHVEACDHPARAIAHARSLGLGVGVALNPETPVEDAVGAGEGADLVLCMSIHPVYSGQAFMTGALTNRAVARRFFRRRSRSGRGGIHRGRSQAIRRRRGSPRLRERDLNDDPAAAFRELAEIVAGTEHDCGAAGAPRAGRRLPAHRGLAARAGILRRW
jgi:ribulose-phosphate 3-epimerase